MTPKSQLLLPPKGLSSCIAIAVMRDTRGAQLSNVDRFNYFPASPLITVTKVISGELRLIKTKNCLDEARDKKATTPLFITHPQTKPTISWSPASIHAVTIGFYPDAWLRLGYDHSENEIPETMTELLGAFDDIRIFEESWAQFCRQLLPKWEQQRNNDANDDWPGSDLLSDWSKYIFSKVAISSAGKSLRTFERRVKYWTGKNRQQIEYFSKVEELHKLAVRQPNASPSELAIDAGFSDQSHMGRAVHRTTGFSPAKLNHLIETAEPFWCYRLLAERF